MCRLLEISRSYYYKLMKFKDIISEFKSKEIELDQEVKKSFFRNNRAYGSNRVTIELNKFFGLKTTKYKVNKSLKR